MPLCYTKVATFHVTHRKSDTSIIARIGNFHITSKKGDTFYSVRRKIDPFHITSWFALLFTPRKRLMFLAFTWKLPTHSTLVWENCKRNCASPDNSQSLTNACFPWIKKCAAKVFFFHLIDGNWRQFFFHLIDGNGVCSSSEWLRLSFLPLTEINRAAIRAYVPHYFGWAILTLAWQRKWRKYFYFKIVKNNRIYLLLLSQDCNKTIGQKTFLRNHDASP